MSFVWGSLKARPFGAAFASLALACPAFARSGAGTGQAAESALPQAQPTSSFIHQRLLNDLALGYADDWLNDRLNVQPVVPLNLNIDENLTSRLGASRR